MVSLAVLQARLSQGVPPGRSDDDTVRRQWWAALATLQDDFLLPLQPLRGVWLASPLPALYEPALLEQLQGWVWAPAQIGTGLRPSGPLLPGAESAAKPGPPGGANPYERLALEPEDGTDPLLVLITPQLQLAMALEGSPQQRRLVLRFDPTTLSETLALVDERLRATDPRSALRLRKALQELGPLRSEESTALRFWPRLAERLAAMAPSLTLQPLVQGQEDDRAVSNGELALLEALTHEVRTPLATIRTLIRSVLRRTDLPPVVRQRLEQIDGECSEQIDRFGLIFHAAELQRRPRPHQTLARTDLAELLQGFEELWQRQLRRRGLKLELAISGQLPPVLSDPNRLETMLGGLVDRFIRSLPSGSTVLIRLQPAGSRLKLQLRCTEPPGGATTLASTPEEDTADDVGPVLRWNPLTGSLQLSRQATQRLFHSLGGRFTERAGQGLTVFFPVAGGETVHDTDVC
ncbi:MULTISPECIES: HAMP domain-containing sensor histidine kinase [unclassified Synechococcus]|uniref:sensor histidine kinase n=1 Tax=Synechococcales TaxID=1890424 RepID=UPI0016265AF2|nr:MULTISPECIES: HAMP domain-containing sensor histidine kinase [unclassified Synechococcus]